MILDEVCIYNGIKKGKKGFFDMTNKEFFSKLLLDEGKMRKHYTYEETGILCGNCQVVSCASGATWLKKIDHFYFYPEESEQKQIELCFNNEHYGYAHIGADGLLYDNSNRSVFEII